MHHAISNAHLKLKNFDELTSHELYEILRLRSEIFVVEQNCVYLDLDNLDQEAVHLLYTLDDDKIVGYVRLLKPSTRFPSASIGRVVTHEKYRHQGISTNLMKKAIQYIFEEWKTNQIRISAQKYLRQFYESLGFIVLSDEYLEDGIPHYEMRLTLEHYWQ